MEDFLKVVPSSKPIIVRTACCQQFIMSRSLVRARPLSVWKKLHQMIGRVYILRLFYCTSLTLTASGVSNVCHKGDMDFNNLHTVKSYKLSKAPPETRANGRDNRYGQMVQGFTMEHLAHVVFGQKPLRMPEPDMLELCTHFVDESQCSGSPCNQRLIASRSPTNLPSSASPTVTVPESTISVRDSIEVRKRQHQMQTPHNRMRRIPGAA